MTNEERLEECKKSIEAVLRLYKCYIEICYSEKYGTGSPEICVCDNASNLVIELTGDKV